MYAMIIEFKLVYTILLDYYEFLSTLVNLACKSHSVCIQTLMSLVT